MVTVRRRGEDQHPLGQTSTAQLIRTRKNMKYSPVRLADGRHTLTPREACWGLWGLALAIAALGFSTLDNPPPQPFAGRLAWLYKFADSQRGTFSDVLPSKLSVSERLQRRGLIFIF